MRPEREPPARASDPGPWVNPELLRGPERHDAFGFDSEYYDKWIALARRYRAWLQVDVSGLAHIPVDGPALLVCNHAGLRIYDMMCLQAALRLDHPALRTLRALGHVGIEKVPVWGRVMLQYAGTVLGHHRNAEYLLSRGELVAVSPEGGHSTDKSFRERDRVCRPERWGDGWLRLALGADVPVIPVAFSGFETAVPTIYRSRRLGRFWGMHDGRLPLAPQSVLTLGHPALSWTMPFPIKCMIDIGPPVDLEALSRDPIQTEADLRNLSLQFRDLLDRQVSELAIRRRRRRRRFGR